MAGAGAAQYQAGVANMNAQIAEQNAGYERAKGEYEAEQIGMKGRYQLGTMKTTQAASGVDVNTGSAVGARTSMASITSLEEATARNRAQRAAYGYQVEATGDRAQAGLYGMQAESSKKAGMLGALSSIIGGAGSVSDKWLAANRAGMSPVDETTDFFKKFWATA
jgi:hypothetical protein